MVSSLQDFMNNIAPNAATVTFSGLPANYLKGVLDLDDVKPQQERIVKNYVHVANLMDFCPRKHALALKYDHIPASTVTGGHRVMWDIGRAVEKRIRDRFILARDYRGIFGKWACKCEKAWHTGYHDANIRCGTCGGSLSDYKEFTVIDEVNGIKGNSDLLFIYGDKIYVTEIKSMNPEDFKKLESAKADHIHQAVLYRNLLHRNGFNVADEVVILYYNKLFVYGSPYKEFHINTTGILYRNMVQESIRQAKQLKDYATKGVIPPREACKCSSDKRATKCQLVSYCFI